MSETTTKKAVAKKSASSSSSDRTHDADAAAANLNARQALGPVDVASSSSPLKLNNGKTPSGNDPDEEYHYENALDPQRALPPNGYPYLDEVQRVEAEIRRAAVEDREPDLENPGPTASSPLRSFAELNNPSNTNVALNLLQAEPVVVIENDFKDEGQ